MNITEVSGVDKSFYELCKLSLQSSEVGRASAESHSSLISRSYLVSFKTGMYSEMPARWCSNYCIDSHEH